MSFALNIFITIFLVLRLFFYRHQLSRLGRHGSDYIPLATMIVESAAIYSSICVLLIITLIAQVISPSRPVAPIFLQILSPVQVSFLFLIFVIDVVTDIVDTL
jgi:hypothetical protein